MKQFILSISNFFTRPFPFIRRHLWYSLLVLLINFVFYAGLILLVNRLFEAIWIENIFQRLTEKSIYLRPLYLLNQASGNPLLNIMQPLMLYLAYSLAFALSTILTGSVLGFLSLSVERDLSYDSPFSKISSGVKGFFKDLKEELFMLALTICWTAVLFFIALIPGTGIVISLLLFYLITPLFQGAYNLSYFFIRQGIPYTSIYKRGFSRFFSFYGFSIASASGFFLILFLLKAVPYGNVTFVLLFALNAFFRPLGVISGTLTGIDYSSQVKDKLTAQKGKFARGLTVFAFGGALLILFTGLQFYTQSQSKLDLIDCHYQLQEVKLNLPRDFAKKSWAQKILAVGSFVQNSSLQISLLVKNPTQRIVFLEDFAFVLSLSGSEFSKGKITGFQLEPGATKAVHLLWQLDSVKLSFTMLKSLLKKKRLKLTMKGWVSLNLWFGRLTYPVTLIK